MKFKIFLILLFLSSLFSFIKSEEKVIFAWQMHRHGARAPFDGVINGSDAYKEKWIKKEELSQVGKRMLYLLGVKVRKKYIEKLNLLSQKYNPQEIYIRSTDVNRTIESIESFLQGLYPTGTGPIINEKIRKETNITYPPNSEYKEEFKKIINKYNLNEDGAALPYKMSIEPIHLFYIPRHEFKLYDSQICKGHREKYEEQKSSKKIHDFGDELNQKFGDLFFKLEKTENKTFLHDYMTLNKYMDAFICDETDAREFDYLLKNFNFNQTMFELLRKYAKEYLWLDYTYTNYPEGYDNISIVANSYTFHSIVNWMENAIEGSKKNKSYLKYVIFSAHDSSIGALEYFMKYAFGTEVDYSVFAESRYLELYLDDKNEYRVRYLRGNDIEKKNLTFNEFKKTINEKTWTDEKVAEFCQFEDNQKLKEEKTNIWFIFFIFLVFLNVILILIIMIVCLKK